MSEKTHAQIVLERIEAVLEDRAGSSISEYTVEGRSIVKIPLNELLRMRDKYRVEREKELRIEELKSGKTPNKIKVRFLS